jgi:8-oxo-dGTP diphosphatase
MRGDFNYCARCGSSLTLRAATLVPQHEKEQHPLLVCTNASCGRVTYRNAKPCAGVLIERDGQLLMVQRAVEPFKDMWDIPGGFLQEWEHPTECALREVREETGLEVELIALLGIFVDTYGSDGYNTLNVYYRGRLIGGTARAADDALGLGWFAPYALPEEIAFPDHERHVLAVWREAIARTPNSKPEPSMAAFVSPLARRGVECAR